MRRQVLRGFLASVNATPPLIVAFAFNPETVQDNKEVTYADRDDDLRGNAPGKVYTGGGHRTISFDLQLHGLEPDPALGGPNRIAPGVSGELATLRSFLHPRSEAWEAAAPLPWQGEGRRLTAPPRCIFGFGRKVLECLVTDLSITETQFGPMLDPVRADVSVELTVVEDAGNPLYELDRQRRNATAHLGRGHLARGVG